jgi:hypothetical protein
MQLVPLICPELGLIPTGKKIGGPEKHTLWSRPKNIFLSFINNWRLLN